MARTAGIHHVTAIASDARRSLEFYTSVLGLRLVKKTVNFDDPGTYHFYFGDRTGRPGTILTFFPWRFARAGRAGPGQAAGTALSVPRGSLGYWAERLDAAGVAREAPVERLEEEVLALRDPDGLRLELVAGSATDAGDPWPGGGVPEGRAIRGVHGVTLAARVLEPSARFLTELLGLEPSEEARGRYRFEARGGGRDGGAGGGRVVDVVIGAGRGPGIAGAGTVHHVAFRAADDAEQAELAVQLSEAGVPVTPVQDRYYFRSIYFHEPGGVLFEIATDPPGFTRDETVEELGSGLKLPPWLEPRRSRIARVLPPLAAEPAATTGSGA